MGIIIFSRTLLRHFFLRLNTSRRLVSQYSTYRSIAPIILESAMPIIPYSLGPFFLSFYNFQYIITLIVVYLLIYFFYSFAVFQEYFYECLFFFILNGNITFANKKVALSGRRLQKLEVEHIKQTHRLANKNQSTYCCRLVQISLFFTTMSDMKTNINGRRNENQGLGISAALNTLKKKTLKPIGG